MALKRTLTIKYKNFKSQSPQYKNRKTALIFLCKEPDFLQLFAKKKKSPNNYPRWELRRNHPQYFHADISRTRSPIPIVRSSTSRSSGFNTRKSKTIDFTVEKGDRPESDENFTEKAPSPVRLAWSTTELLHTFRPSVPANSSYTPDVPAALALSR